MNKNLNTLKENIQGFSTRTRLVNAQSLFVISLIVTTFTILSNWYFGLGQHRTIFINSMLSTGMLTVSFLLFITVGLYRGIKLKDDMGKITDKINLNTPDISNSIDLSGEAPDLGDDIGSLVISILFWILFSIALLVFIWFFGAVLWAMLLFFIAMLYWIFFRALRLVFKSSKKCKGQLVKSIGYGLFYTVLYNFWVYGIILAGHYLIK